VKINRIRRVSAYGWPKNWRWHRGSTAICRANPCIAAADHARRWRRHSGLMLASQFLAASCAHAQTVPEASPLALMRNPPPNVLVWILDDVGFGQLSTYGGLVPTPNIERVARQGLIYDNYHTAPVCSASRASLLTGRMPHSVNVGGHAALPIDGVGYNGKIPSAAGTIAENLRQAGYATFALGKWDHLPTTDTSPAGPFTYWPLRQGFDHFYGYLSGDTDQFHPTLIKDMSPVRATTSVNYHFSKDLADEAIGMIRSRDGAISRIPFFMYWATTAVHAPHQAPKEWLDRFRGKFDMGWDRARELILKQEIARGLVKPGTKLAPRPEGMPPWSSLSSTQKKLYARQMEAFAAALAYADAQFGRVLDELQNRGELGHTMIFIMSDNGASAEGGPAGLATEAYLLNQKAPTLDENMRYYDSWGGPTTYPLYHFGWAVAGNTPFRYYKQTTYEGGQRVPLIVAYPDGISAHGELRRQYVHVSDIAPTVLDTAGVVPSRTVNNVQQSPMEGVSQRETFATAGDPRDGRPQYTEMFGNKGLEWDGWAIVTKHRVDTWRFQARPVFDERWELYDLVRDPSQRRDLASEFPEKVAAMSRKFDEQAELYHVYPLHNASDGFPNSAKIAAAGFEARAGVWRFTGSTTHVPPVNAPPVLSREFQMKADLDFSHDDVSGTIFALGGPTGGIGFYIIGGKPVLLMTQLNGAIARVDSKQSLDAGTKEILLTVNEGSDISNPSRHFRVMISSNGRELANESVDVELPRATLGTFSVGCYDATPMIPEVSPVNSTDIRIKSVEFSFKRSL